MLQTTNGSTAAQV